VLNPGGVIVASFGNAVGSGNFAVRRRDFLAVGGFDESLPAYGCEDYEFCLRMNEAGHELVGAPDMQMYFRRTDDRRVALRKTYTSALAETVVWARHPDRYGRELSSVRRLTAVLRWPVDLVRTALRRRSLSPRSAARDLVVRVGNLAGWFTVVRNGRVGPPQLLAKRPD
jgi:GT2 family glycosyltransferase